MREFGCPICGHTKEIYHPSLDPLKVPAPMCCGEMQMLFSVPQLDTSSTFKPFEIKIEGISHQINNLRELRSVEKAYDHKHLRFDAWSENPSSEAYGPEYNPRDANAPVQPPKRSFGLPTMSK